MSSLLFENLQMMHESKLNRKIMKESINTKYAYEIYLNSLSQGNLVGDNGDKEFNSKDKAHEDALNFITSELSKEYNKPVKDFKIKVYKIEEKLNRKLMKEGRNLSPSEFNKLKIALNKHNTLKNIFVLSAVNDQRSYKSNDYTLALGIYGKFKAVTSYSSIKNGAGTLLYNVYINLIDESIKFSDFRDSYYIKKYIESAVEQNELTGADPDTLYNNILNIIENSKKDLEKVLKSKNFIYNLTGRKPYHDDDEYNLDLDESVKLIEDFDPSMPNWLMRAIKINNQNSHNDHKDFAYNYELDKLKWTIDNVPKKGKLSQYFDNGYLCAVLIDKSGDKHTGNYIVYSPSLLIGINETIEINGRNRSIDSMSMKALTPYIKEIAYTQLDNSELRQKQNDRYDSQKGTVDRYDLDSKPYNKVIDKSGYIIDPNKYTNLLAKLHLNDYSNRLSDLYIVLSDVKSKIKDFINTDNFLPDAKSTDSKYSVDYSAPARDFQSIYSDYKRAIENYKYAMEELNNIEKGTENYWNDTPAFKTFNKYVNYSEEYCAKVITKLDK